MYGTDDHEETNTAELFIELCMVRITVKLLISKDLKILQRTCENSTR
jgi:hypothetical protein